MREPSISRKVQISSGLIVSFSGEFWFFSQRYEPHAFLPTIGFLSAVLCAMGALIYFWAAIFAYLVRKWDWSPRSCGLAGLVFVIPTFYFFFFATAGLKSIGWLLFLQANLSMYLCRRIAFPQLTDEQFSAPQPPPSLFPK